jgi:hypothetical protein
VGTGQLDGVFDQKVSNQQDGQDEKVLVAPDFRVSSDGM